MGVEVDAEGIHNKARYYRRVGLSLKKDRTVPNSAITNHRSIRVNPGVSEKSGEE